MNKQTVIQTVLEMISKNEIKDEDYEIHILDEGSIGYHLQYGTIDHKYLITDSEECVVCACGRRLRYVLLNNNLKFK